MKKIILGVAVFVGGYYAYQVLFKGVKIDRVHTNFLKGKTPNDYTDASSCQANGHYWGTVGMPSPNKKASCHDKNWAMSQPV
jgi:hypothetical protein